MSEAEMVPCRFCLSAVPKEAQKCRHCGEWVAADRNVSLESNYDRYRLFEEVRADFSKWIRQKWAWLTIFIPVVAYVGLRGYITEINKDALVQTELSKDLLKDIGNKITSYNQSFDTLSLRIGDFNDRMDTLAARLTGSKETSTAHLKESYDFLQSEMENLRTRVDIITREAGLSAHAQTALSKLAKDSAKSGFDEFTENQSYQFIIMYEKATATRTLAENLKSQLLSSGFQLDQFSEVSDPTSLYAYDRKKGNTYLTFDSSLPEPIRKRIAGYVRKLLPDVVVDVKDKALDDFFVVWIIK